MLLEKELEQLKEHLIKMSMYVETAIKDAVQSLVERNDELATKVIGKDHFINNLDVEIDEECIRILALTQPMAKDLRFITTAMKITTDLERIADNAVNIAERALELNKEPILKPYIDIPRMSRIAQRMVRDTINAYINSDKDLAKEVIMKDDEMDDLNEMIWQELMKLMNSDPSTISRAVKITYISKYLERIADHATNIAEDVIYMIEGKIIRHRLPDQI
ncbi:MAG: phosphate signaling complex protein PhoU [Nitrospiraceae bacterium]|nr:MAG: phosphate signaling complex protein PhoU [Nitrospiraceae bacterium]UCH44336.1 MAG: phosphate signaling complex protein PhoU [Nitrospiraceae bacterium]